jgi:acid phosphatase
VRRDGGPRVTTRLVATLAIGACLVALVGCGSGSARPEQPARTGSAASLPAHPAITSAPLEKVLVFVVENHSLDQMRTQMPYTFSLAERYGYATSYRALTHPSLGNYIAITGGSTMGIEDDRNPVAHLIHGPSVFSEAISSGGTAAVYAEGMTGTCALENNANRYVVRHNPWTYFVDDRAACEQFDVSADQLPQAVASGDLPNVGMVIPDICNDAHSCSLASADRWMQAHVEPILDGPDWKAGRLAIVITADEDDHHQDNQVLTTVVHPSLQHVVVDEPLTHLSLSRLLSEVCHQPPLREAASAPSLGDAFHLPVGG